MTEDKLTLLVGGRRIVYYTFPTSPDYKVLVLQASGWRNIYYVVQGSIKKLNTPEVMSVLAEVFRPHFTFFFSTVSEMKLKEAKVGKDGRVVWIGEATCDISATSLEIPQGRETGGIWLYREISPYKLSNIDHFEDNVYYIYSDVNIPTTICTRIKGKWFALKTSREGLVTTPLEKVVGNKIMNDGNPLLTRCKKYNTTSNDVSVIVNNALEWHYHFPDPKKARSPSPTKKLATKSSSSRSSYGW